MEISNISSIYESGMCTGCLLCVDSCPKKCISANYDTTGNIVPLIDESKCINCGVCQEKCPINTEIKDNYPFEAYAALNKDVNERLVSSSGGVAHVLSKFTIEEKGIVIGAAYDEKLKLKHILVEDLKDLPKLQGSKYSQSLTQNIYSKTKAILDKGKIVLFIGVPCQIAALYSYLDGKEYPNLTTVDLVCHGIASQKYLDEYLEYLSCKTGKKANRLYFRGLNDYFLSLYSDNKLLYHKYSKCDSYFTAYLNALIYRESCYSCKYAHSKRLGDITLGDFWGYCDDGKNKNMKFNGGLSMVLVNTAKGKKMIHNVSKYLVMETVGVEYAISHNKRLNSPVKPHKNRDEFLKEYCLEGFVSAVTKTLETQEFDGRMVDVIYWWRQKIKNIFVRYMWRKCSDE